MDRNRRDIQVPNVTDSLEQVRGFVFAFLEDTPFEEAERRRLVLAVDETVASNILCSEALERGGETELSLEVDGECFRARVRDTSREPDRVPEEEFENVLERARKHEIGIFLVQQIMDEIRYTYCKGIRNELELVRYLPGRKSGDGEGA